jgi:hypothetical protein
MKEELPKTKSASAANVEAGERLNINYRRRRRNVEDRNACFVVPWVKRWAKLEVGGTFVRCVKWWNETKRGQPFQSSRRGGRARLQ